MDYRIFDGFDYVALGHIHSSYHVGRRQVRYAGSPLCYHFDEIKQPAKGFLLVEMGEKGEEIKVETVEIPPLHPMREIRGSFEEIKRQMQENLCEFKDRQDCKERPYVQTNKNNKRQYTWFSLCSEHCPRDLRTHTELPTDLKMSL